MNVNQIKRHKNHRKIRMRISGGADRPRLCVFRSANHVYAQLIDDQQHKVLASASDLGMKKGTKTERSRQVGEAIAKQAKEKKISRAVFDRAGFRFHGRIKAVADGARESGLAF